MAKRIDRETQRCKKMRAEARRASRLKFQKKNEPGKVKESLMAFEEHSAENPARPGSEGSNKPSIEASNNDGDWDRRANNQEKQEVLT